jgi:hypothetical protein
VIVNFGVARKATHLPFLFFNERASNGGKEISCYVAMQRCGDAISVAEHDGLGDSCASEVAHIGPQRRRLQNGELQAILSIASILRRDAACGEGSGNSGLRIAVECRRERATESLSEGR